MAQGIRKDTRIDMQRRFVMKRLFLCALIAGIFLARPVAEGADWILFGQSNIGTAYYDRAAIQQRSGDVIRVTVKYAYSPEGVREFREAFPGVDASETISYSLYIYELNCAAGSFWLIKAATYNSAESVVKGTELDFDESGQATPEHITPNSMMEQLSGAACRWRLYDR